MRLFRANVISNNCVGLCPDNCWRWKQVGEYPSIQKDLQWIQINISNRCNARCVFCYQTNYEDSVQPGILEEFKRDYLPRVSRVYFGGGEPLIVAREVIESVIKDHPHIQIGLVTNGTLLEKYMDVMDRFFEVNFSLNAGTRDCYSEVMGIDSFDRVVANIRALHASGFQGHLSSTFVLCRENMHDAADYLRLCSALHIQDCGVILDGTDPFLVVPERLKKDLCALAKDLGLHCDFSLLERKLSTAKTAKQLISYIYYYAPRRIRDRLKRHIQTS